MGRLAGVLALTRAFGDFTLKKGSGLTAQPSIKKVELKLKSKYIVIASDGVWDYLNIGIVQKIMKEEGDSDSIATEIIKASVKKGSVDNISVIVIKL